MSAIAIAARLLLAAVFAVAGIAKLADRAGLRATLAEFRVPPRLIAPSSLVLPLAELAVAALLLPSATTRVGALAALALLTLFGAGIAAALARGERPDCHCFGRVHSAPVGWRTLTRNGGLTVLAVLVVSGPVAGLGWTELVAAGGAALLAAQAWLWLELLRRYGRALRRIDELEMDLPQVEPLEVGDQAPAFVLPDLDGRLVSLDGLLEASGETILLFTSPGCGACDLALDETGVARVAVVVVSSGERQAVAAKAEEHALERVLLDEGREVATQYGVIAVPAAVAVDADGRIAGDPAVGAAEVVDLLSTDLAVLAEADAR